MNVGKYTIHGCYGIVQQLDSWPADVSCLMDKPLRKTNKKVVLPAPFSQGVIFTLRDTELRLTNNGPICQPKVQVIAVFSVALCEFLQNMGIVFRNLGWL